jgi:hypothetical protein
MMTQMCHLPYRTLFQKQDLESFFMQTIDTKIQANDLGKKKKKMQHLRQSPSRN